MQVRRITIPASLFSAVLGLVGLGNSWRVAHQLWGYPLAVGESIHASAIAVWLLLLLLYTLKWIQNPDAAKAEMHHGVQGNFVALLPISTMLIALAVWPVSQPIASLVFLLGFAGWLLFALWHGGRVFTESGAMTNLTHALYIPWVAGNFAAALVGNALGWIGWDQLFFGAGLVSWLVLESVVLLRLATTEPLPAALRATFGIQLAPPAVGLVAYLAVTPEPSALVVHMLLGYAVLQVVMLVRLLQWICAQGWSMSYWAISFGVTALALGAQRWVEHSATAPVAALAHPLFFLANGTVALLLIGSIWAFLHSPRAIDG